MLKKKLIVGLIILMTANLILAFLLFIFQKHNNVSVGVVSDIIWLWGESLLFL